MIDVKEHIYHDDPAEGHPDVRTFLRDVSYFFLGNGSIQAAVQFAPGGEGSPYGLILQDPDRLAFKRDALTLEAAAGLEGTMLTLKVDGRMEPIAASSMEARWRHDEGFPQVEIARRLRDVEVRERFSCPDFTRPAVVRAVRLVNRSHRGVRVIARTHVPGSGFEKSINLKSQEARSFYLCYTLADDKRSVRLEETDSARARPGEGALRRAGERTALETGHASFDRLFRAAAVQLSACVSARGCIDASLWQYTREWVRDHSFMALGLIAAGHHDQARVMLDRLIREFVAEDGSAMDSSERRPPLEAELDQNGILLLAVRAYVDATGDEDFARGHWPKLAALAEFPLGPVFRHAPSGLLCNGRDFWERHAAHGIEPGLELSHQVFVSLGLDAAADLAARFGKEEAARRFREAAAALKRAVLAEGGYGFVERGRLIKRRGPDGRVQERIEPRVAEMLPPGVRLAERIPHPLDPDSAAALAVAWEFLDPRSAIAEATLYDTERLWNQGWSGGGYGRYHMDSDPDCPGPWPLVTLYVARAYLEMERYDRVQRALDWFDTIPGRLSGSWFELLGPRVAPPYAQIGIIPWAWAEALLLGVRHLLGIRPEARAFRIRPRPLPSMGELSASLRLHGCRLSIRVRRDAAQSAPRIHTDLSVLEAAGGSFLLDLPRRDCAVEILLP